MSKRVMSQATEGSPKLMEHSKEHPGTNGNWNRRSGSGEKVSAGGTEGCQSRCESFSVPEFRRKKGRIRAKEKTTTQLRGDRRGRGEIRTRDLSPSRNRRQRNSSSRDSWRKLKAVLLYYDYLRGSRGLRQSVDKVLGGRKHPGKNSRPSTTNVRRSNERHSSTESKEKRSINQIKP